MSSDQLFQADGHHVSFVDYADQTWYDELVRMQNGNTWADQPLLLNGLFQEKYAESLISRLREKPYFRKFGGRTLEIVMTPSYEPYMYNIGLKIIS